MQPELAENAPARWESIITDLTAKQQTAREHVEQLRTQKRDLALEAAMGGADARKKLEKANAELARLTLESDDWDAAIAQAQRHLADAREAEAAEAEKKRKAEMRALASTVVRHAEEFTSSLRQATKAGEALKLVIRNMIARANPQERVHLDQLLQTGGPYMRAAEHAGLRAHIEFMGYPGPREHILALEDAISIHLGGWLIKEE